MFTQYIDTETQERDIHYREGKKYHTKRGIYNKEQGQCYTMIIIKTIILLRQRGNIQGMILHI